MTIEPAQAAPAPPADRIAELVELSQRFGDDPEFSRGGGGNSSFKADSVLYIKPSGASLAGLTAEALIGLDVRPLLALLDSGPQGDAIPGTEEVMRVALEARLRRVDDRRPSVECLFHALLPEPFVLHTHPTIVNAVTCATDGAGLAERLFGSDALWVPYTEPGLPLARAIRDARRAYQERTGGPAPRAVFLQNHGLIVTGDSAAEIEATSAQLVGEIRRYLDGRSPVVFGPVERLPTEAARSALHAVAPALRALLATERRLKIVTLDDSPMALEFAGSPVGRRMALGGPLTPDQIVYTGSTPLVLELSGDGPADQLVDRTRRALDDRARQGADPPVVALVPGLGIFAAGATFQQADMVRQVYLDAVQVSVAAERMGGIRPMADAEREFIERWEAEEYRRRVASGSPLSGRARGLVAVVTGAAQGFGLAIAADLVAQGAHVALADMNAEQAGVQAADLAARFGAGRAIGLAVDVTDDASVAACFDQVVRRFGGLDLLVSNAGVLRAGSVTTQPIEEFDAVTRVNYRGYFLCVRHAAPILACQHRARREYWGDIIEINSKSGLAGSSRNSAYAGSKFGGIGLTQSFALELVGDGIKVNAICPGNFLDGPLWSDPRNGLFVQYLREGKVPGASTVEDVRRFYEAKVPMGRGCTPADVLEALYYVIAQQYETGQAVPVTGGQVMVR